MSRRALVASAFACLVSGIVGVVTLPGARADGVPFGVGMGQQSKASTAAFNPATATGAVGFWDLGNTSTLIKGGYDFNGSTQKLDRTTGSPPCVSGGAPQYPISIVCWFKLDTTAGANMILVALNDQVSGGDLDEIRVAVQSGNTISAAIVDNSSIDDCLTTASIVDGRWHCVVAVYVSASSRAIYSDVDTTGATDSSTVNVAGLDATRLASNAAASVWTDGVIAYTAILPVDLSGAGNATKRTNIFKGADPVLEAGLTYSNLTVSGAQGAAWKLDNALTDSGPGGYTLTATASPTARNDLVVVRDQTSGAYHMRATTSAPTWSSTAFSNHGGGVFASASSQFLSISATPVTAPPFQVYAAVQVSSIHDGCAFFLGDKDVATDYWAVYHLYDSVGTTSAAQVDGATTSSVGGPGVSEDTDVLWWYLEASNVSRSFEQNGGGTGTDTTDVTPDNADSMAIGMLRDSTPSGPFDGRIGAVLLLSTASTSQQSQTEDWFETNLGISIP